MQVKESELWRGNAAVMLLWSRPSKNTADNAGRAHCGWGNEWHTIAKPLFKADPPLNPMLSCLKVLFDLEWRKVISIMCLVVEEEKVTSTTTINVA